jgi:hypothetical protein
MGASEHGVIERFFDRKGRRHPRISWQRGPCHPGTEQRIATFDQDGRLWVEHPMYTEVVYCLERVPAVVKQKPELKDQEPFKTEATWCFSKISMSRAKSTSERLRRSSLWVSTASIVPAVMSSSSRLSAGRSRLPPL